METRAPSSSHPNIHVAPEDLGYVRDAYSAEYTPTHKQFFEDLDLGDDLGDVGDLGDPYSAELTQALFVRGLS